MKLRAEDLVKRYKSRTVVKGVSVDVQQGEIVGLLGPNGAGKTTSFYMIVGLIKPNGGVFFWMTGKSRKSRCTVGHNWVWGIWRRRLPFSVN